MGNVYIRLGQYAEALTACEKAIAIEPDLPDVYRNRAVLYHSRGDYDKAWTDVKSCRKLGGQVHPGFLAALQKASGRKE
jgi:tetratricopeptide (TPR) repeat protein